MDTIALGLWAICITLALVILEPLAPQATDLVLRWFWIETQRTLFKIKFHVQILLFRASLDTRNPLARLLREFELWRIRRNPAYKEFFNHE